MCLTCVSYFVHLFKWLCMCACLCAPLSKFTITICGNVPDIWELFCSFVEMAVPACLPMCPNAKIHYIYFVAMCLSCGRSFANL